MPPGTSADQQYQQVDYFVHLQSAVIPDLYHRVLRVTAHIQAVRFQRHKRHQCGGGSGDEDGKIRAPRFPISGSLSEKYSMYLGMIMSRSF